MAALKQSKLGSFGEAMVSTAVGFSLSLFLQWAFFDWWLGLPLHFHQNLIFAVIMTVVSVARGYLLRRVFEHFGLRARLSPAMQAVIAERARQKSGEGFDEAHDDEHADGELAYAGICYILSAIRGGDFSSRPHATFWPWDAKWWKPAGFWRDMVRGVALVLAEMDKALRQRAGAPRRGGAA